MIFLKISRVQYICPICELMQEGIFHKELRIEIQVGWKDSGGLNSLHNLYFFFRLVRKGYILDNQSHVHLKIHQSVCFLPLH